MDTNGATDILLRRNREYERATGPGSNNHVPMVLVALYRMGGSVEQMLHYTNRFDIGREPQHWTGSRTGSLSLEDWQSMLGRGRFSEHVEFFEHRIAENSVETVLKEVLDVLMRGVSTEAYHALLRLGYALDYNDTQEVAFALAYWAAYFYPGPDFKLNHTPLKPAACLAGIVNAASSLQIEETNSIDDRIRQVYRSKELTSVWHPIQVSSADPLEEISAGILEAFSESHHFTLLHALTSCQALRLLLPYLTDPAVSLSHYWNSVCAAYVTVSRVRFKVGQDTVEDCGMEWEDIFAEACAKDQDLEHTVKLVYACYLESQHYHRKDYLPVACRELEIPSLFL